MKDHIVGRLTNVLHTMLPHCDTLDFHYERIIAITILIIPNIIIIITTLITTYNLSLWMSDNNRNGNNH